MKKPNRKVWKTKARAKLRGTRVPAAQALARGSLSPEVILQAALAIADREGLACLTLRKIATKLDASPMAIYRHFRNKAELVAKLPDYVVGIYGVTEHATEDWRDWIVVTLLRMRTGLLEHPGVISLLGSSATSGPNAFAVMERFLAVVRKAGVEEEAVIQLFHLLMSYTVGAVAIENAALQRLATSTGRRQHPKVSFFFESAARAEYPNLEALAPKLALFASDEFFAAGVRRMMDAFAPPHVRG